MPDGRLQRTRDAYEPTCEWCRHQAEHEPGMDVRLPGGQCAYCAECIRRENENALLWAEGDLTDLMGDMQTDG